MKGEAIIAASVAFIAGGLIGYFVGSNQSKSEEKTEKKEEKSEESAKEEPKKVEVKPQHKESALTREDAPEQTHTDYAHMAEQYVNPEVEDNEEQELRESKALAEAKELYFKNHKKDIEVITEEKYEDRAMTHDYADEFFDPIELYYFYGEDILTDNLGHEIDDWESMIGDALDRYGMRNNKDTNYIYLVNNRREEKIKIEKIIDATRDEYFEL